MNGNLLNASITDLLAAVGGLGTAAFGLVDASKAFWAGPSNFGFGRISNAIDRVIGDTGQTGTGTLFGKKDILKTLRADWVNGVATANQKAAAKSLIHLFLSPSNADQLAKASGVDPAAFAAAVTRMHNGTTLTPQDMNVLGRFDAIVSAVLDEGYERGDQQYRNAAKILATLVATVLAVIGGWIINNGNGSSSYFSSTNFGLSVLVGLLSTPLAPIAKDLSSSLSAAVKAVNAAKG